MPEVAVMTDTVSYIPGEIASKYNIMQAPAHILMDGESYPENEMDLAQFYARIPKWRQENKLPTTSSPSPDDFVQAYRKLSKECKAIVYIGYSTQLGMAVQSASLAKDLVKDELAHTEIEVLDSKTCCGAQTLITIEAARVATSGGGLGEVLEAANDLISRVNLLILSDDLYYLAKGGRIHKARPWADSKISNTVILRMNASTGGQNTPAARCKTKGETLKTLFDLVQSQSGSGRLHVAINHADAPAEAEQLKEKALSDFQCEEVFISNLGPLVTTHTGLGTRFFGWWADVSI